MKRLLYPLLALMFISTTANANIYGDCEAAISANDLDEVKKLAVTIQRFNTIAVSNLIAARLCVSTALGEPMVYMANTESFITLVEFEAINAKKALSEAEKEAERIALEKLKSQLKAAIANLEKRTSCVRAKSSRTGTELDAINKRFEKSNQSLILNDTHEACTKVYSSDKAKAMLNQTCVDAFQRMGHPNLVFSESEQKAVFSAELMGLLELEADLEEELMETKVKLLEADGIVTEEAFNQKVSQQLADDLEAKSCGEFGYEGVYLD
jgi:septal ring factor EnvC (AmiA/AmiB activator)